MMQAAVKLRVKHYYASCILVFSSFFSEKSKEYFFSLPNLNGGEYDLLLNKTKYGIYFL